MAWQKLHYFPIAMMILFPATFITTYTIAVLTGHVAADFPYISDTGTKSPESCIFGQMMNIGAVLSAVTFYIRYRQVREFSLEQPLGCDLDRPNRVSLNLGMAACFGLSMVGNFQETNVLYVHMLGALLCFGLGTAYLVLQSVISYRTQPIMSSLAVARIRVVISVCCGVLFFLVFATGIGAHFFYHGNDITKWQPKDGGWELHVASTVSEWIMSILFFCYFITFVKEFRTVQMESPKVQMVFGAVEAGGEVTPTLMGGDSDSLVS